MTKNTQFQIIGERCELSPSALYRWSQTMYNFQSMNELTTSTCSHNSEDVNCGPLSIFPSQKTNNEITNLGQITDWKKIKELYMWAQYL